MSACGGLDSFLKDLSELSKADLLEASCRLIKRDLLQSGMYFIDEESRTLLGLVRVENAFWCVRLERRGHHCTKGLIRRIRAELAGYVRRYGLPIYVKTPVVFDGKKARKLLKLTGFKAVEVKDGNIISKFGGR